MKRVQASNGLSLVVMSEQKWKEIEYAIDSGDTQTLQKLVATEREKAREYEAETETIENLKEQIESGQSSQRPKSASHMMYNMQYDSMDRGQLMDMVSKFAKENRIPVNALRFAVQNIADDYTVHYEAQYNEDVRKFINEGDKGAMLTYDDEMANNRMQAVENKKNDLIQEAGPIETVKNSFDDTELNAKAEREAEY